MYIYTIKCKSTFSCSVYNVYVSTHSFLFGNIYVHQLNQIPVKYVFKYVNHMSAAKPALE